MNPLDSEEFQNFLQIMKRDMPHHSPDCTIIKRTYSQGLPKSLTDYSEQIDNKFLNENLAIIEEIQHREPKHIIPRWFREYQNHYFVNSGILNHDGFFKTMLNAKHRGVFPYTSLITFSNASINRTNHVNGATLETVAADSTDNSWQGNILASKLNDLGTVGEYYDQVAVSLNTAAGNWRLGVYDDSGSTVPQDLYAETGSAAAATGYAWNSVTEFALTTTQNWAAFQYDNAGVIINKKSGLAAGSLQYKAQAFGAFANPISSPSTDTRIFQSKIGHS